MKKTIMQLRKERITAYRIAGALCCALIVGSFPLHIPQLTALLFIIAVGMASFLSIYFHYTKLIGRRLFFISSVLMDPALIQKEANLVYLAIFTSWKQQFSRKYYESMRLTLLGDFSGVLSVCEGMPAQSKFSQSYKVCCTMMCNLRLGRLSRATESLNGIIDLSSQSAFMKRKCKQILGAYFLERGDVRRARENLTQAMNASRVPIDQLDIHFDLARLEEKEGNPDKAIEHYKQAAAIGPKTWMGQEAARRAEALWNKG